MMFAVVVAIDFFLKSFVIISIHCRLYDASDTGFKQITESESQFRFLNRMHFLLNPDSDSLSV